MGGAQERHHPALGLGAPVAAVAAPHLAVDDRGPDRLLSPPVGGVDAVGGEEGEQRVSFVAEVLDQLAVGVVGMGLFEEQVEALAYVDDGLGPAGGVEVSGIEGLQQQVANWRGVPRPRPADPRSSREPVGAGGPHRSGGSPGFSCCTRPSRHARPCRCSRQGPGWWRRRLHCAARRPGPGAEPRRRRWAHPAPRLTIP